VVAAAAISSGEESEVPGASGGGDLGFPLRTVVVLLAAAALLGGLALVVALWFWLRLRRPDGDQGSEKLEE
jgi:hypothetical protein